MTQVPVLHTRRCLLAAMTPADIPVLRQILDDEETQRFLPELCGVLQTEDNMRQFIQTFHHYLQHDEGILWGIYHGDAFVGFIAIMEIPDNPTLFYDMHPAYRRKGLMKESVKEVVSYMESQSLTRLIRTELYENNSISKHILESCGFKKSGLNALNKEIFELIIK